MALDEDGNVIVTEDETDKEEITNELPDSLKPPVIMERPIDRVPWLHTIPTVTVYAEPIGMKGFRFGIVEPLRNKAAWSGTMTGRDAMLMLKDIKRKNKHNRLESLILPK